MNREKIEEVLRLLAGIELKDWERIESIVNFAFKLQKRELEGNIQLADFEVLKRLRD